MGWNLPHQMCDLLTAVSDHYPEIKTFHMYLHNTRAVTIRTFATAHSYTKGRYPPGRSAARSWAARSRPEQALARNVRWPMQKRPGLRCDGAMSVRMLTSAEAGEAMAAFCEKPTLAWVSE